MHAATLKHSPRLQRVRAFLADARWHSTRDIMAGAHVCAVNSCVSELRANSCEIECRQTVVFGQRLFYYRLVTADQDGTR